MSYEQIEIIEKILRCLQPKSCLEWGAGYGTIYFSRLLAENSKWISIEHEKEWMAKITNINQKTNVKIFYIRPNQFPPTDDNSDGTYSDLKNYIEFPSRFGKFDFILIDGRARESCLIKAHELIGEDGVVVLHDAEREYYQKPFSLYKYQIFLGGYNEDGKRLWIGSEGIDINNIINIAKYIRSWRIFNKIKIIKNQSLPF